MNNKRKSAEQLCAENIFASLVREYTPAEILAKAQRHLNDFKYAIAQEVTITIMLATLWDMWEDFDEKTLNEVYDRYLEYHKSFKEGKENIFLQMYEINRLLGGRVLDGKLFDVIKEKMKEDEQDERNNN